MVHAPKQRWKASLPEHPGLLSLQTLPRVYHFTLKHALVLVETAHRLPCIITTTLSQEMSDDIEVRMCSHHVLFAENMCTLECLS